MFVVKIFHYFFFCADESERDVIRHSRDVKIPAKTSNYSGGEVWAGESEIWLCHRKLQLCSWSAATEVDFSSIYFGHWHHFATVWSATGQMRSDKLFRLASMTARARVVDFKRFSSHVSQVQDLHFPPPHTHRTTTTCSFDFDQKSRARS